LGYYITTPNGEKYQLVKKSTFGNEGYYLCEYIPKSFQTGKSLGLEFKDLEECKQYLIAKENEPRKFTTAELNKAKEMAYINWENDGKVGFEFEGTWITNPFLEETGRFEFVNYEVMCEHYGEKNVVNFIKKILLGNMQ